MPIPSEIAGRDLDVRRLGRVPWRRPWRSRAWLLGGSLAIEEFKEIFGIRSLPGEGRHYRTLAGFLMMQLGRIPSEGEHFEWGTLHFEVVDMDRHRIDKIIAKPR